MPTLAEACQQLRIGRVTLAKWIDRLGIQTTRHEWDYRFQVISPEDVERIADARRKLPQAGRPGVTGAFIPIASKPAFDRRDSDETALGVHAPMVSPASRQRPLQRDTLRTSGESLPQGWMSRTDCADLHNFPRTTLRRWAEEGRIETAAETYGGEHGTFPTAQPVTARGMAHRRSDFTRCERCPHGEGGELETSAASADGE